MHLHKDVTSFCAFPDQGGLGGLFAVLSRARAAARSDRRARKRRRTPPARSRLHIAHLHCKRNATLGRYMHEAVRVNVRLLHKHRGSVEPNSDSRILGIRSQVLTATSTPRSGHSFRRDARRRRHREGNK
eukprot:gene12403-biopygen4937